MGRATQAASIARPLDDMRVRDLDQEAQRMSQRTYLGVMRRSAVRRGLRRFGRDHQLDKAASSAYAHRSALFVVMGQMLRLARAGATLAELLRFGECLLRFARMLAGAAPRSLKLLDLEEQRLDGPEDELQLRRAHLTRSPEAIVEEIEQREQLVGVNCELIVALREELRRVLPTTRGMQLA